MIDQHTNPFAWSPGPRVPEHLFNRARFEVEHWNAICVDTGILLREQGFCPEKLQEELRA